MVGDGLHPKLTHLGTTVAETRLTESKLIKSCVKCSKYLLESVDKQATESLRIINDCSQQDGVPLELLWFENVAGGVDERLEVTTVSACASPVVLKLFPMQMWRVL